MSTIDPLTDWKERNMRRSTQWDVDLFNMWTLDLPSQSGERGDGRYADGTEIPLASGPHIVQVFRLVLAIIDSPSPSVLEIGFNRGHSAAVWLGLDPFARVTSLDVVDFIEQHTACKVLRDRFCIAAPRHRYFDRNVFEAFVEDASTPYDLASIDGAHTENAIVADIALCRHLRIPWLLFDDWYPKWGDTQVAVDNTGLKLVAVLGGMALCHSEETYT